MIRVLLVDDEALVRSGLRLILEAAGDIAIVAEARDGNEAVNAVQRHRPDVVLMDVRMPVRDGLSAAAEVSGETKVVMLTTFDMDEYVHTALRAGAVGFLLKDTPPRDLAEAVRTVAAGHAMLSPAVTWRLIKTFAGRGLSQTEQAKQRLAALTDRELEVVLAVGRGLSNAEIARELAMAETTVKAHVSRALAKLGANNRVQAAILVHDAGLT